MISKAFVCGFSQISTHDKAYDGHIDGIHMWFDSLGTHGKAFVGCIVCGVQVRGIISSEQ